MTHDLTALAASVPKPVALDAVGTAYIKGWNKGFDRGNGGKECVSDHRTIAEEELESALARAVAESATEARAGE